MSPSAAPKRASAADDNSANKAQKRRKKATAPRDAADDASFNQKPKRRRLNDDLGASQAKRAQHRPLGPRNSNQNITSGPSPEKKLSATQHKGPASHKHYHHGSAGSQPRILSGANEHKSPPQGDEVRSLRSKDAARPKSDLSKYFPDFEDVILGEAEDDDFFAPETVLHITDRDTKTFKLPIRSPTSSPNIKRKRNPIDSDAPSSPAKSKKSLPKKVDLNLVALAREWEKGADDPDRDPLSDDLYRPHRRAERQEKQARNTDKERAMHEKSELQRLLGDLRSPDWLRTLGISGITETQKRTLEPKRDIFILRVQGLLDRFASWKEREKELKAERERRLQRLEEMDNNADSVDRDEDEDEKDEQDDTASELVAETKECETTPPPPSPGSTAKDCTDHETARRPPRGKSSVSARKVKSKGKMPDETPPFKSFFAKKHQRAAAMEKHRRGRHTNAFGQPIPEMEEVSFELPDAMAVDTSGIVAAAKRKKAKPKAHRNS